MLRSLTRRSWIGIIVAAGIVAGVVSWNVYLWDSRRFVEQPGLHFTIVLEPGFEGWLRLVEDPNLPLDYERQYDLVQDGATLPVPNGSIYGHVHHIEEIRDKDGTILATRDFPRTGEFGLIGNLNGDHPDFEEVGQYWLFGIETRTDYGRDGSYE